MGSFNTNSNNTNYTSTTTTSDQIKWTGGDIVCKNEQTGKEETIVCNGKNLTVVQNALAEKICGLVNSTDINKVVICDDGGYFTEAFKNAESPIAEILQQIINATCAQEGKIEDKADKDVLNTAISIDYCCCVPDGRCTGVVTVSLAQHIKNILDCVCAMKAQLTAVTNALNNSTIIARYCQIEQLQAQVTEIRSAIATFNKYKFVTDNKITIRPPSSTDLIVPPVNPVCGPTNIVPPVSTCTNSPNVNIVASPAVTSF